MGVLRFAVFGAVYLLFTFASMAQQVASASPTPSAPAAATTIPSYPDTAKGLENIVKDMLKLEKEGNQQELAAYEKSLALPDADGWFKTVFGEDLGSQMTVVSEPLRADAQIHTIDMLAEQLKERRTDIRAVRFKDSCSPDATATEYPFLLLRKTPEPLYDVRFLGSSGGSLWAYFAYVDGGFRFIGNMRKKEFGKHDAHPPIPPTRRIRIGGNVTAAKLTHREDPEYPPEAKARHIEGTVLLHAIIAKDGSVQDLYLEEGQCWLAQSAMDAVKHWRYSPTLLQGEPVEVDTTIQVIYTLR
ncbi:MAG: energy transducer TonB [Candidatus Acidiferrales bacterium]